MGSEAANSQPDVLKENPNSFSLEADEGAEKLMGKWEMKIAGDRMVVDGKIAQINFGEQKIDMEFFAVKSLVITSVGDTLIVAENSMDGSTNIYKGKSPQDILDALVYVGILYMERDPSTQTNADKIPAQKLQLEAAHPEYKTEYKQK